MSEIASNETLEQKVLRLEKSNDGLSQLFRMASHDLKSPLNAIHQLACWVKEDCEELLPVASVKHLDLIKSRAERMTTLLSDILSYSQIDSFTYDNEPVALGDLVTQCFEALGKPEGFSYDVTDTELCIPRIPLAMVMRHLISNSIKHHHHKEGHISIQYQTNMAMHCITVIDDGPGIPDTLQNKVVELFQTLKPRDHIEGSGMGLAFVKKIVEHYKGKMTIKSDGMNGTRIIIDWPL